MMGRRYQGHKQSSQQINQSLFSLPEIPLSPELNHNIELLKSAYHDCSDVIFREFSVRGNIAALLLYIEGLSNMDELDENVLSPLIQMKNLNQDSLTKEISVSGAKEIYVKAN